MDAAMEVHTKLGHGFLEALYKDALEIEFDKRAIKYEREKKYEVYYKGNCLQHYYIADFVGMNEIIIEIKCVKRIKDEHIAQTINYLKASGKHVALLINFSRGSLEYKRLVYSV
ncbi:MAG: GxxExxY protein [Crocinitomicaceae bacterium]